MLLKRIYDRTGPEPVLDHVKVLRANATQHFTQNFIDQSLEDGFITLSKGQITLHTQPELTYNIVRTPGYFCCFDNKKLGSEEASRAYVAENFAEQASPDSNNPAGYRKDNFYACELISGE